VQDLRPSPIKPDPEKPVGPEKPWTPRTLTPQDRHLVPEGDELEFQRSTAPKPKSEK
jgi:hypothetical protein